VWKVLCDHADCVRQRMHVERLKLVGSEVKQDSPVAQTTPCSCGMDTLSETYT
jgi:hypothetical protein